MHQLQAPGHSWCRTGSCQARRDSTYYMTFEDCRPQGAVHCYITACTQCRTSTAISFSLLLGLLPLCIPQPGKDGPHIKWLQSAAHEAYEAKLSHCESSKQCSCCFCCCHQCPGAFGAWMATQCSSEVITIITLCISPCHKNWQWDNGQVCTRKWRQARLQDDPYKPFVNVHSNMACNYQTLLGRRGSCARWREARFDNPVLFQNFYGMQSSVNNLTKPCCVSVPGTKC